MIKLFLFCQLHGSKQCLKSFHFNLRNLKKKKIFSPHEGLIKFRQVFIYTKQYSMSCISFITILFQFPKRAHTSYLKMVTSSFIFTKWQTVNTNIGLTFFFTVQEKDYLIISSHNDLYITERILIK